MEGGRLVGDILLIPLHLCCLVCKACLKTIIATYYSLFPVSNKDISNDVVLITGGGRGIGRQIALQLAKHKPKHIVLWGRSEGPLRDTTSVIQSKDTVCSYYICDVSSREQIYKTAERVKTEVGDVSILVNNAGVVFGKQIIHSSDEEIIQTFQVNALAPMWITKAFLPSMLKSGKGHIVLINSVTGLQGLKGLADYSSSKYASSGFMEALGAELEEYKGINLTTIHPYQVDNDMFAGCTVRFPWLFPPLSESYVARRSVTAILRNERQIIMPRIFYLHVFIKSIVPTDVLIPSLAYFRVDKYMDTFHQGTVSKHE